MAFFSFIAAVAILGIIIFYRSYEVRIGRFDKAELAQRELIVTGAHIEALNNKALQAARHALSLLVIVIVKGIIKVLFWIRRESRRLSTKLDHFFLSDTIRTKGSVSFFLKDIGSFKEKRSRFGR